MAVKDFNYLARRMHQIANGVGEGVNTLEKELAIATVAHLARSTPVDTGRARSNWRVSLGEIWTGTRGPFSPFPSRWRGSPRGAGGSLGETRNTAGATWSASGAVRAKKEGQSIYIVNNLPYIEPLNEGHSKQVAPGFIERAINSATAQVFADAENILRRAIK